MAESVTLIECPRDAFQGLPRFIPTETKADYLLSLIDAGFRDIDFGSFVSAKAVPQMQDTRRVLEAIRPYLGQTRLIAIVPNLKGLEAAIDAEGIRCAGFALSVSATFQRRNFNQTLEQAWTLVAELREKSQSAAMEFVVYLSMAFGNPFGDTWSPEATVSAVERLLQIGVSRLSLADTIGVAQPSVVHDLFSACARQFPNLELGAHLHARPDRWEDVIMAAYFAGCRRFDGALLGMGGCPFAEDRLVGNIRTNEMVRSFSRMGLTLGVTEESIETAVNKARSILSIYSHPL